MGRCVGNMSKPKSNKIARLCLYLALVLMVVGLFVPFMTIHRFGEKGSELPGFDGMLENLVKDGLSLFADNRSTSKSIASGIQTLCEQGQIPVALLILFVSVIFPLAKLTVSILLMERGGSIGQRTRWFLERFGPWSLLDATLVALLIIASQGFPLGTSIVPSVGFYIFTAAIILSYAGVCFTPERKEETHAKLSDRPLAV